MNFWFTDEINEKANNFRVFTPPILAVVAQPCIGFLLGQMLKEFLTML